MKDLISIIVPCYNEEESLRLFHEAVKKTEAKLPDYSFEILLVNDGSKDRTLEVMRELAQQDCCPKCLRSSSQANMTVWLPDA